jgi:hypothetical protein
MNGIEGTWSLGFLIGIILVTLAVLVLLAIALAAAKHWNKEFAPVWCVGAIASITILLGVTACVTFPWESQYHRFEPKVGEVQAIDKRLVRSGEGMQEKLVVRFSGIPGQFGCEDTRCASVRTGDMLALRCIKRWDYSASDGYDCRFVAYEPKAGA